MPDQTQSNPSSSLFDRAIEPELERSIYDQLHKIAHFQLLGHRQSTINTTMLVHEAYIKISSKNSNHLSKTHFFALSAHVMRQVVIDHARQKKSQKRGGLFLVKTYYDDEVFETDSDRLFQLDQA